MNATKKAPIKRKVVAVPADLHAALRHVAIDRDTSVAAILRDLITEVVQEHQAGLDRVADTRTDAQAMVAEAASGTKTV